MKLIVVLSIIAVFGTAFAKPSSNKKENIVNALLALEQEEGEEGKPVKQEDDNGENGRVLEQVVEEDPALIMEGEERNQELSKIQ